MNRSAPIRTVIAARLCHLREGAGLSATKVAILSNVATQQVLGYERADHTPSIEVLQKILRVYGMTLSRFFGKWENGEPC